MLVRGPGRLELWFDADLVNAGTLELQAAPDAPAVTVASIRWWSSRYR